MRDEPFLSFMTIFIGADHRGYKLKEKITKWLFEWKYEFEDLGAQSYNVKDDYTKYASEVASLVADNKKSLGVLLCGSGVGVEVVANKFDGIRASVGVDSKQVEAGRRDDNMNVLVIAADHTSEHKAREMLRTFLKTKFDRKVRHERRLADIKKIEENN